MEEVEMLKADFFKSNNLYWSTSWDEVEVSHDEE